MSYACTKLSFIFKCLSVQAFYFVQKLCKLRFVDKHFLRLNFTKYDLIVNRFLPIRCRFV